MAVYMATITGSIFGNRVQNVIHFRKEPSVEADKALLAVQIRDRWLAQVRFACTQHMAWNEVMVVERPGEDDLPAILPVVVNGFQGAPNGIAPFVCAVFRLKTQTGGRKGRGRFYISGVDANSIMSGRWGDQQMINFRSIATSLKQWFTGSAPQSGFNVGVAGRNLDESDFKECSDIVPRDYPGSQVRRNFFRGT